MKKIKYALLPLLLLTAIACKISTPIDKIEGKRTSAGKLVYDQTTAELEKYLQDFNFLQNLDLYIQTANPVERAKIENTLFPNHKIDIAEDGTCTLKGDIVWTILTNNRSLNSIGTNWSVSCKYEGYDSEERTIIPKDGFLITCTTPDKWNINLKSNVNELNIGNAVLEIECLEKRPQQITINSDYGIAASGKFTNTCETKFLEVTYNTILPLVYKSGRSQANGNACFVDGILEMSVINTTHAVPEKVKADLTSSLAGNIRVRITFKGLTEVWKYTNSWENDYYR